MVAGARRRSCRSASPASSWRSPSPALLALPLLPSSYWQRLASITDEELDETGSREARSVLLRESFDAFVDASAHRRRRRPVQELQPRRARKKRGARATTWSCRSPRSSASSGWPSSCSWSSRAFLRRCRRGGCCAPPAPDRRALAHAPPRCEPLDTAEYEMLSLHTAVGHGRARRLVRLRAVRVGRVPLDVLLPARARRRAARLPAGACGGCPCRRGARPPARTVAAVGAHA